MNNIEQRAKELFNNPLCSEELNNYNQQQWAKAMHYLGDKHILAIPVGKKQND